MCACNPCAIERWEGGRWENPQEIIDCLAWRMSGEQPRDLVSDEVESQDQALKLPLDFHACRVMHATTLSMGTDTHICTPQCIPIAIVIISISL